ncbi:FAD protein [Coleophoma cylindrospora]|uniref:FAD protein n=1 Tax=Coleophoma cylindrospora TaxID=1849047 RepID=A0A3D8QA83_9HELO|nr:FAD protein [Coleophoma cylindrospora]
MEANVNPYVIDEHPFGEPRRLRVITIGAGASGLNVARAVGAFMKNIDLQLYEKNADVGGTWLENRYPGCACDIPSHNYQYTWEPNPYWNKYYAPAAEILKYFQGVADKYNLRKYIKFQHQVVKAVWDEDEAVWNFKIKNLVTGEEVDDYCHFFINASGYLNNWKWPDIPGLHSFKGSLLHSAAWDPKIDLKDKAVAVLGCGSSGIQIVPSIQPTVKHLTTFIRSPTWITAGFASKMAAPGGNNFDYTREQKEAFAEDPEMYLKYRKDVEHELNSRFKMLHKDTPEQAAAIKFAEEDMRKRLGSNSQLADSIIPKFSLGCRRPTPGNGYLEALNCDNVRVVSDEIERVVEDGIVLKTGELIKIDAFICATGFDVSFCPRFPIIGRKGIDLRTQWKDRATAYMSLTPENIPNYFMFMGPNSPVGHGSAPPIIEHLTKYMLQMIYKAQLENIKAMSPSPAAIQEFTEHSDIFLTRMAWSSSCRSWFKNGSVDGPVTALHPGSRLHWFKMLEEPRYEDWEWTTWNKNRFAYLGNGFSTKETDGRDLTWYFDSPDAGYERLNY